MSNSISTYTGAPGSTNYALYNSFTPAQLQQLNSNYTYLPSQGGYLANDFNPNNGQAIAGAPAVSFLNGFSGSPQSFIPAPNPNPTPTATATPIPAPAPIPVPQPVQAPTDTTLNAGNLQSMQAATTPPISAQSPSDATLWSQILPALTAQNGGSGSSNAMPPASTADLGMITPQAAPTSSSGTSPVLLILLILLIAGGGYWWYKKHHKGESAS